MYLVDTSDPNALEKVRQRLERGNADAERLRPVILGIVEKNQAKKERRSERRDRVGCAKVLGS